MLENKKIFILGMARSGYEVVKLLSPYQNTILITDMKEQDPIKVKEIEGYGATFIVSEDPKELLDSTYDVVIKNPAIRGDHPTILKAKELGISVVNEVEVAYHYLPKNINIIGITGSNGKTTTTTIIYEIFKKAGLPVHIGGNIGFPLSSLVCDMKENDYLIIEISDHQLLDMYDFKTDVSVLTNLSETHLDFHGSYDAYKSVKKKIFQHHTSSDLAVLNFDNEDVMELTNDISSEKVYFSSNEETDLYFDSKFIYYHDEKILSLEDILLKGRHNYENIMCAIAVAKRYGICNSVIVEVLKEFRGVEHRLEYVDTIRDVVFYNDSKSTNVVSTIIALDSFQKPTILLLGGLDRGHSFDDLSSHLENLKTIVCYGEVKQRISDWALSNGYPCISCDTLEEAVLSSSKYMDAGDVVLFSPACASWDQYACFEDRGNEFKKIVSTYK